MKRVMSPDAAETIGLDALGFIAGNVELLSKFLFKSGLEPAVLREQADNPATLRAALDFLLADDAPLMEFCRSQRLDPRDIHVASQILGET
ncbi:MAG: DUF3572 domain-containing protein [Alphaproteobacteria bacterium]|nr:DUF3572 domain-containing protein [Alphaproteobacteria bacterium]